MLARCINRPFRDLKADGQPMREVGDEFEATAERIAEINRAGYGVMAESVETPAGAQEGPSEARKAPAAGKDTARRRGAAKKAE